MAGILFRGRAASSGVAAAVAQFALTFPSNVSGGDTAAPLVAIKLEAPHNNGLPAAGPANAGVTIIRRIKCAQQTGYYAQIWWSEGGGAFLPAKGYWGIHPYPQSANNTGTTHWWEIAAPNGGDYMFTRVAGGTTKKAVAQDTWFTQALRIDYNGGSPKLIFYTALSSTADADVIEYTLASGALDSGNNPTNPVLMIGDSPWYAGYQHERASMQMSGIKIVATLLSEADTLSEAADMSQLVTSAGQGAIWWGKNNFETVDDLTCDYGTGRTFVWADTGNKGTVTAL